MHNSEYILLYILCQETSGSIHKLKKIGGIHKYVLQTVWCAFISNKFLIQNGFSQCCPMPIHKLWGVTWMQLPTENKSCFLKLQYLFVSLWIKAKRWISWSHWKSFCYSCQHILWVCLPSLEIKWIMMSIVSNWTRIGRQRS